MSSAQILNSFTVNALEIPASFSLHGASKGACRSRFRRKGLTGLLRKTRRHQRQCEQSSRNEFEAAYYTLVNCRAPALQRQLARVVGAMTIFRQLLKLGLGSGMQNLLEHGMSVFLSANSSESRVLDFSNRQCSVQLPPVESNEIGLSIGGQESCRHGKWQQPVLSVLLIHPQCPVVVRVQAGKTM